MYKNIRNASWKCLIDFKVNSLPVKLNELAKNLGVVILKNSDAQMLEQYKSGITVLQNGIFYIIYNDRENIARCRYTVAHELGHIVLGHLLYDTIKYRTFKKRDEEEKEADMFAIRLLAPACVLYGLNLHTAEDISRVCNISYTAAKYRAERMKILYERNMFLASPLERQVYEQFKDFIENTR